MNLGLNLYADLPFQCEMCKATTYVGRVQRRAPQLCNNCQRSISKACPEYPSLPNSGLKPTTMAANPDTVALRHNVLEVMLKLLTDADRLLIMKHFCPACGTNKLPCMCTRDE